MSTQALGMAGANFAVNLLWRWPSAMWSVVWSFCTKRRLRWLPFAPWVLAVVVPGMWDVLRWLANLKTPADENGLDAISLMPGFQRVAASLVASIEGWFGGGGLMANLLFGAVGILAAAYFGTGPIHAFRFGKRYPRPDSHGSAAWGTAADAATGGHVVCAETGPQGLMLGRLEQPHKSNDAKPSPRYQVAWHVLTCAPTRSGKGIGGVVPNLLQYPGSTFALDLKGELYAVTARARMQMGFAVARLDPFGLSGQPSNSINLLDGIDVTSDGCVAEAAKLADALVVRAGSGESHWDDQAEFLIKGLILYVTGLPKTDRHLGQVRDTLMLGVDAQKTLFEAMAQDPLGCGVIRKTALAFLSMAPNERSGVLSTARRHTAFLDDPQIVRTLRRSDFAFGDLKKTKLSVYLMMPPDSLSAYSRYMRIMLARGLRAMTEDRRRPEHHVVFFCDEVAQLGRMDAVEKAIPIVHGYGALLWLFVQDLSQLRSVYRNWESFLGNTVWQFFGTQDQGTLKYVSEALGNSTRRVETESTSNSSGSAGRDSHSQSRNEAFVARPLLTAQEVRELPRTQIIVIQGGEKPMLLQRLNYLTDADFKGLADTNPMHA